MTVTNDSIRPFLAQFVATNDRAIWSILTDFFADDNDEQGQAWAAWVLKNRKHPWQFSDVPSPEHGWFWWYDHGHNRLHDVFRDIALIMAEDYPSVYYDGTTIEDAYLALLDCWRIHNTAT